MTHTTEHYLYLNTRPKPVRVPPDWYGWFSLTAKRSGCPVWLAKNEAGRRVLFTCKTLEESGQRYRWADKQPLGLLGPSLKQISGAKPKYIQEKPYV